MLAQRSMTSLRFVVSADAFVEGSGRLLHPWRRLYGRRGVGDRGALPCGVDLYPLGRDGASHDDDVLEHVARGVVDGLFDFPDLLSCGVDDPVALHIRIGIIGAVVPSLHDPTSSGGP